MHECLLLWWLIDLFAWQNTVQWTLAYPDRTMHGRMSKIAGYVNHHANSVYNVSLLALSLARSQILTRKSVWLREIN